MRGLRSGSRPLADGPYLLDSRRAPVAKLASVLQEREFAKDETLIRQGEEGHHFYILDVGECVCTVESGSDKQEVKRYQHGGLFGETRPPECHRIHS